MHSTFIKTLSVRAAEGHRVFLFTGVNWSFTWLKLSQIDLPNDLRVQVWPSKI